MNPPVLQQEDALFSSEDLQKLDPLRIPKHVALIPDGNRRWAKTHNIFPEEGHRIGTESVKEIIRAGRQIGIKVLTFYIFSTENWNRPKREIKALMYLLERMLISQKEDMMANGIRFLTIGNLSPFPQRIKDLVEETQNATRRCRNVDVVFALNYGGRDDICRAFQKILHHYDEDQLPQEKVTETLIASYLDTAKWGDPDLVIRTGGEQRISNFLLWQISYAEVFFTNDYWPDFRAAQLLEAIDYFQRRERRRGG
ncbi:MAG: polyprenyl diphosphate synthase [Waddliaceae bacterium]